MLHEVSKQHPHHGQLLTADEWKDVFTASLKHQRAVPGLDGGFVVLGARTSKMTVQEMSDLIELMLAFGTQHGIEYGDGEG